MQRILCAAIHFIDFPQSRKSSRPLAVSLPKNIESGLVIAGRRHSDVLEVYLQFHSAERCPENPLNHVMGFLTQDNRFVDRTEAWGIALEAGQINPRMVGGNLNSLLSEHLYND